MRIGRFARAQLLRQLEEDATQMHFLIVGLGNPGTKYELTRHNIGFRVLDTLAGPSTSFRVDRLADVAEVKHRGRSLTLVKPTTFMNLSGKAVQYWLQETKTPLERLLVITDDLALPFGTLRLRGQGSDGGHNGLKDIQAKLNTTKYARMKMGIGADFPKGRQVDYVLEPFAQAEEEQMPKVLEAAAEAVRSFAFKGIAQTMTDFNKSWL